MGCGGRTSEDAEAEAVAFWALSAWRLPSGRRCSVDSSRAVGKLLRSSLFCEIQRVVGFASTGKVKATAVELCMRNLREPDKRADLRLARVNAIRMTSVCEWLHSSAWNLGAAHKPRPHQHAQPSTPFIPPSVPAHDPLRPRTPPHALRSTTAYALGRFAH
jgi:hypothetical protein